MKTQRFARQTGGWLACLLLASLVGCSGSDKLQVAGEVTLDGKPLEQGTIGFYAADGQGPTAAAIVAEGKYACEVPPGEKEIRIEGFEVVQRRHITPDDPSSPMIDVKQQIVPARYNQSSELRRTVDAEHVEHDFALEGDEAN